MEAACFTSNQRAQAFRRSIAQPNTAWASKPKVVADCGLGNAEADFGSKEYPCVGYHMVTDGRDTTFFGDNDAARPTGHLAPWSAERPGCHANHMAPKALPSPQKPNVFVIYHRFSGGMRVTAGSPHGCTVTAMRSVVPMRFRTLSCTFQSILSRQSLRV